jgi:hypothetical protein
MAGATGKREDEPCKQAAPTLLREAAGKQLEELRKIRAARNFDFRDSKRKSAPRQTEGSRARAGTVDQSMEKGRGPDPRQRYLVRAVLTFEDTTRLSSVMAENVRRKENNGHAAQDRSR